MLLGKKFLRIAAALAVAAAAAHTAERAEGACRPAIASGLGRPDCNDRRVARCLHRLGRAEIRLAQQRGRRPGRRPDRHHPGGGDHPARGGRQLPPRTPAVGRGCDDPPLARRPSGVGSVSSCGTPGWPFRPGSGPTALPTVALPAMRSDAMVAVYLQDSRLVLGRLRSPTPAPMRALPSCGAASLLDLRVTDGAKVLVGSGASAMMRNG